MISENNDREAMYCGDDGAFRVYCNISDILCIERFYKNHLNSGTDFTNVRKRQQLSK